MSIVNLCYMNTEKDRRLGKEIKKLRKKLNMTQEKLAEKINLSAKFIQFIESGDRTPSIKTLNKIALRRLVFR